MTVTKPKDLFDHVGHGVEAAKYGDTERAIECTGCGEVLADEETQTKAQMDALWTYYTLTSPGMEAWTKVKKAFGWKDEDIKVPAGYTPEPRKTKIVKKEGE